MGGRPKKKKRASFTQKKTTSLSEKSKEKRKKVSVGGVKRPGGGTRRRECISDFARRELIQKRGRAKRGKKHVGRDKKNSEWSTTPFNISKYGKTLKEKGEMLGHKSLKTENLLVK